MEDPIPMYEGVFDNFDWTVVMSKLNILFIKESITINFNKIHNSLFCIVTPTQKFHKNKITSIVKNSLRGLICTNCYNEAAVFDIKEGELLCQNHIDLTPDDDKENYEEIDDAIELITLQCEQLEKEMMYCECLSAFWQRKYVEK